MQKVITCHVPYKSLRLCKYCLQDDIERGAQYYSIALGKKIYHCQKHRNTARAVILSGYFGNASERLKQIGGKGQLNGRTQARTN